MPPSFTLLCHWKNKNNHSDCEAVNFRGKEELSVKKNTGRKHGRGKEETGYDKEFILTRRGGEQDLILEQTNQCHLGTLPEIGFINTVI